MRKCTLWGCGVVVALLLSPAEALCDGYGFYSWGRGWPSVGVPGAFKDVAPLFKDLELDLRHDHYTFGYLYDGASTKEDRFGWRFNFGLDIVTTNLQGTSGSSTVGIAVDALSSDIYDTIGYGFAVKGAYSVGIYRTDRVRLWVGPSVRLNADYVDLKSASFQEGSISVEVDPWGIIMSLGGGIEGGVRYDVSPDLRLDLSTGFHYNFFGFYEKTNLKINSQALGSDDSSFLTGQEPFLFVQLALHFDFNKDQDSR